MLQIMKIILPVSKGFILKCGPKSPTLLCFKNACRSSKILSLLEASNLLPSHPLTTTTKEILTTMASPILTISPKSCLQDERVTIRISGLDPKFPYTLTSHIEDSRKNKYYTYAHYTADDRGVIDTSKNESVGGHYKGVFQMGFIAALQPDPSEFKYLRLFKKDIEKPNKIEIRLYEKFKTPEEIFSSVDSYEVHNFHYRHFLGPGVTRYPIREGRVRGSLFVPSGEGPFPGVVDMFGTAGGLLEYRSAQLASRGIMSLALAFFAYDDLPDIVQKHDLDYFREAVQILLNHPKVMKPHVGAVGVSKGADLALSMATFIPEVTAAVSINGCCSNLNEPLVIREGYVLPSLGYEISRSKIIDESILLNLDGFNDPNEYPETIIPIHKSNAKYLFIVGEDDQNMPSMRYASISAKLMQEANRGQNIKICSYKGAGHLLEPPYAAVCPVSYHKVFGFPMIWGGELIGHTEAQEKAWLETIYFIKTTLRAKTSKL